MHARMTSFFVCFEGGVRRGKERRRKPTTETPEELGYGFLRLELWFGKRQRWGWEWDKTESIQNYISKTARWVRLSLDWDWVRVGEGAERHANLHYKGCRRKPHATMCLQGRSYMCMMQRLGKSHHRIGVECRNSQSSQRYRDIQPN